MARRPHPAAPDRRGLRRLAAVLSLLVAAVTAAACSPPSGQDVAGPTGDAEAMDWDAVLAEARGQQVSLWMYGGDERGNAYVDEVLAPAARELDVDLRRVPVADTADALSRVLAEQQAGREDGSVDLVWVNGENFRTGQQADAWECGWAGSLPNTRYLAEDDPLLAEDFGTPVQGCESPWHKAQFVLAYDAAQVADPPRSVEELLAWVKANPGRFTYPAPPDFTGSAFLRQVLYGVAGGPSQVPADYDEQVAQRALDALADIAPALWRGGTTYPRDLAQLEELYAGRQVAFTMTYGPATLADLVEDGVLPASTRVLELQGGTLGNASFLAVPANAAHPAGAKVVADLALSPPQQLAKADPRVWGQYPVLDLDLLPAQVAAEFDRLPTGEVVPPFEQLSQDALPELPAQWVAPLEDAWREQVLRR